MKRKACSPSNPAEITASVLEQVDSQSVAPGTRSVAHVVDDHLHNIDQLTSGQQKSDPSAAPPFFLSQPAAPTLSVIIDANDRIVRRNDKRIRLLVTLPSSKMMELAMSSQKQTNSNDQVAAKKRTLPQEIQSTEAAAQQMGLTTGVQRVSAAPKPMNPGEILQLQRTVGNRVVSRILSREAQHQRPPAQNEPASKAHSSQNSIQRIVVIPKSQLDPGMIVNVYQIITHGSDKQFTLLETLDLNGIHKGSKTLTMVGHGYNDKGRYANMSAKNLTTALKDAGLSADVGIIHLLSCSSGVGDQQSYAQKLANQLNNAFKITANRGLGVTMQTGASYAKRERTSGEQIEYLAIIARHKDAWDKAEAIAIQASNDMDKALDDRDRKDIIMTAGAEILIIAKQLFDELYNHQKKLLLHEITGTYNTK